MSAILFEKKVNLIKSKFVRLLEQILLSVFFVLAVLFFADCTVIAQGPADSQIFGIQKKGSEAGDNIKGEIAQHNNSEQTQSKSSSANINSISSIDSDKESQQASSAGNSELSGQSSSKSLTNALDGLLENSGSKSKRNLGILDLEEYIATSKFAANPKLEERGILVRVYERIALALCFPSLNNIVKGNTTVEPEPRCQEILEKLAKLNSNNTILICSQKGVDSVDCARAYETQAVRKYQSGELERLDLTSRAKNPLDSPEINARFVELQKKLLLNIETFKAQFSISNLKSLDSSLFPVLAIICSNDGLALTIERASSDLDPNNAAAFGDTLSISEAIDGLNEGKEKPTPTPKPKSGAAESTIFFRTRILSEQCSDTITDALNIDPRLSSAICYRDGFLSPSCLSSLRRIQSLQENIPGTPNSGSTVKDKKKDGLATF